MPVNFQHIRLDILKWATVYKVLVKNGNPPMISKSTFWENDPNKSCRDYEGLSFGDFELDLELDLELDFEDYLKVNIEFLNENPLF